MLSWSRPARKDPEATAGGRGEVVERECEWRLARRRWMDGAIFGRHDCC